MSHELDPLPIITADTANAVLDKLFLTPDGRAKSGIYPGGSHVDFLAGMSFQKIRELKKRNPAIVSGFKHHMVKLRLTDVYVIQAYNTGIAVVWSAFMQQEGASFSAAVEGIRQDYLGKFTTAVERYAVADGTANVLEEVDSGPLIPDHQGHLDRCLQHVGLVYNSIYSAQVRKGGATLYHGLSAAWPISQELQASDRVFQGTHRLSFDRWRETQDETSTQIPTARPQPEGSSEQ